MPNHKRAPIKAARKTNTSKKKTTRASKSAAASTWKARHFTSKRSVLAAALVVAFVVLALPAGWIAIRTEAEPVPGAGMAGDVSSVGSAGSSAGSRQAQGEAVKKASDASAASKDKTDAKAKDGQPAKAADTAAKTSGSGGAQSAAGAKTNGQVAAKPKPAPAAPAPAPVPAPAPNLSGLHTNISTTVFWVGEAADASNAYISNAQSAWDGHWQSNFGGFDDPDHRNGYHPAGFTPKENPFYFALPYNDLAPNGSRKASASNCPNTGSPISWCKNAWIKINFNGKTAYAQWQDVGPMLEDDTNYVFGNAAPANGWGAKAGLDVSPAVRDYLGLSGIDRTSWSFVPASAVPAGPWRDIVTTNVGGW